MLRHSPQAAQAHKVRNYSFQYLCERSTRDMFTADIYYCTRNVTFVLQHIVVLCYNGLKFVKVYMQSRSQNFVPLDQR